MKNEQPVKIFESVQVRSHWNTEDEKVGLEVKMFVASLAVENPNDAIQNQKIEPIANLIKTLESKNQVAHSQ